jgi:hypothetical protein
MDADSASRLMSSPEATQFWRQESPPREPVGAMALRFTRRASLILTMLLSLGLWAAMWAAVASLASAILG